MNVKLFICSLRLSTHVKAVSLDPYLHKAIQEMSTSKNYSEVVIAGDFNNPKIKWVIMDYIIMIMTST